MRPFSLYCECLNCYLLFKHARQILMNRKGEKPWKPYPPKRSVSLNKADVVKATTSASVKRTSSTATDMDVASTVEPGPAIVSVVPVDVSGRPFARLRNQPKVKAPEQEVASLNGSLVGRVPARYSTILNASNYGKKILFLILLYVRDYNYMKIYKAQLS